MANKVDIFNRTLIKSQVTFKVNDPNENTPEARDCASIYDPKREALLELADWSFARTKYTLSLTGAAAPGWEYEYHYPQGVRVIRGIVRATKYDPKIPFTTGSTYNEVTNAQSRVIWTDQPGAAILATRDVKLPSLFPGLFVEALTSLMAAEYSAIRAKDYKLSQKNMQEFQWWMNQAITAGELEAQDVEEPVADWITKAYGTGAQPEYLAINRT